MTYKPGTFFSTSYNVVDSTRFKKLSAYAQAAYYAFKRAHNGKNNGNLVMSSRMMAQRINCSPDKAAKAILELGDARLLEMTTDYVRGDDAQARAYRLLEHKCNVSGMRAGAASSVNKPLKRS
jgi:hypothetical protein